MVNLNRRGCFNSPDEFDGLGRIGVFQHSCFDDAPIRSSSGYFGEVASQDVVAQITGASGAA